MKIQLTDVHILSEEHEGYGGAAGGSGGAGSSGKSASGSSGSSSSHHSDELDDLKTIHKMMDLATLLKCPHVGLDEVLRELATGLKHHCDNNADVLDIEIKAGDNRLVIKFDLWLLKPVYYWKYTTRDYKRAHINLIFSHNHIININMRTEYCIYQTASSLPLSVRRSQSPSTHNSLHFLH